MYCNQYVLQFRVQTHFIIIFFIGDRTNFYGCHTPLGKNEILLEFENWMLDKSNKFELDMII